MISKCTFEETIREVGEFYTNYDKTISQVEMLFEGIGKYDKSVENENLNNIISILEKFWEKYDMSLEEEYDEDFSKLLEQLLSKEVIDEEFLESLKKIQAYFRNCSILNAKPIIHRKFDEIIEYLFKILKNNQDNSNIRFHITKILSELITDNMLVHCGLSRLDKWNYGTDKFCNLTPEEQLVLVVNQAIMIDRIHGEQYHLKTQLKRLNRLIDSFEDLNWTVYYVAGFLNFKIHNYKESRFYFERVELQKELINGVDEKQQQRFFHSSLLIAYGYEYEGSFSEAIKKIVNTVECVFEILKDIDVAELKKDVRVQLDNLGKQSVDGSLFYTYFGKDKKITDQIDNPINENTYHMQIEILHALAHCINEYAIENCEKDDRMCPKLIVFSRAIMKYIAEYDCEYWTCYATIHGEYKDYDIALEELENAREKIKNDNHGMIKESLSAEIDFYCYYFNQMLHLPANKEKEKFLNYCKKYSDNDAECHIQIFSFRSELQKYLCSLFEKLRIENQNTEKILELPSIDSLRKSYGKINKLRPSLYVNINVRAELQLMQRVYMFIYSLRKYLLNGTELNKKRLINSCKRYCCVKKELNLSNEDTFPQFDVPESYELTLPEEVNRTLFGDKGIVHCLNSSDTVFLLAPISGVVVYQYQTGTIDSLFTVEMLIHSTQNKVYFTHNQMTSFIKFYFDTIYQTERQYINGLDWKLLVEQNVDSVYWWSKDVPFRLLQATQKKDRIRWLTNPKEFEIRLNSALHVQANATCTKKRRSLCRFQEITLKWIEVINESNAEIIAFCQKTNIDGIEQYLIVTGNFYNTNTDRHIVHSLLDNVELSYFDDNDCQEYHPSFNIAELLDKAEQTWNKFKSIEKQYNTFMNKAEQLSEGTENREKVMTETQRCKKELDDAYSELQCLIDEICEKDSREAKKFCGKHELIREIC